jgi:hypothetical protein
MVFVHRGNFIDHFLGMQLLTLPGQLYCSTGCVPASDCSVRCPLGHLSVSSIRLHQSRYIKHDMRACMQGHCKHYQSSLTINRSYSGQFIVIIKNYYSESYSRVVSKNLNIKIYKKGKKVKSLCLTKHHTTKVYWGVEV